MSVMKTVKSFFIGADAEVTPHERARMEREKRKKKKKDQGLVGTVKQQYKHNMAKDAFK